MTTTDMQTLKLAIIGAPTSVASFAPGQEKAPAALRAAGLEGRLRSAGIDTEDLGDLPVSRWTADREWYSGPTMARIVADVIAARDCVASAHAAGYLPLLIGGNCTLALAMVAGTLTPNRSIGLIYFDGHLDLNTPTTEPDGAMDWMGVTHLLGVDGCIESLRDIGPRSPLLTPECVVFLGVNADSVTAFEKRQRQELHLQVIEAAEVMVDARAAALRALEWLPPDIESLLVHFDVDVIDFFDLPLAENYVRFGGLRLADAQEVLRTLLSDRRFDGLTITELNPDHGAEDGSTLSSFIDLLVDASSESPRLVR